MPRFPFSKTSIYDLILVILLVVSAVVRIPFLFTERLGSDEALYAWCAQRISIHPSLILSKEIIEYHPPLFFALLALGQKLMPFNDLFTDRLIALFLSLLGIVLIYIIGYRVKNKFVGLFCAVNLAFNYTYWLNSNLILIDIAQMNTLLILFALLMKIRKANQLFLDISIGLTTSAFCLLKINGIIIIPFVFLCYWSYPGFTSGAEKLKRALSPMSIVFLVIGAFMLFKYSAYGRLFVDMNNLLTGGTHPQSPWFYLLNLHNILTLPVLLPLLAWGIWTLAYKKSPYKHLLFSSFVLFAFLSIPPLKYYRYTIILLPPLLLIAGTGLDTLLTRFLKKPLLLRSGKVLIVGIFLFLYALLFPQMQSKIKKSFSSSTGFPEAVTWIKSHMTPSTVIFSQNLRPTRYFTGINYKRFEGQLILLPLEKKEFEKDIRTFAGPIIVLTDLWSESNPSEFRPFSKAKREETYFKNQGFELVKVVRRNVYKTKSHETVNLPVIKIYERP